MNNNLDIDMWSFLDFFLKNTDCQEFSQTLNLAAAHLMISCGKAEEILSHA